jgi:hypothetical protein
MYTDNTVACPVGFFCVLSRPFGRNSVYTRRTLYLKVVFAYNEEWVIMVINNEKVKSEIEIVEENDVKTKKTIYKIVGGIFIFFIIARIFGGSSSNEAPAATSSILAVESDIPVVAPVTIPAYAIGQEAKAGTFTYNVSDVTVTNALKSEYDETKTEDQFVVVKMRITNGDVNPRDISSNAFILRDQSGNTYEALDRSSNVGNDEPLYYETINPRLSRTRVVIFETPAGISGLTLRADSGVALAGGEFIEIDLGQ